jgi:hypothetical protein
MEGCTWPSEWPETWPADVLSNRAFATDEPPAFPRPALCEGITGSTAPSPQPPSGTLESAHRPRMARPKDSRRL